MTSARRFAPLSDAMIAVEPDAELCTNWDKVVHRTRKIAQLPVGWDSDRAAAVRRAHEQFRRFGGGWKVNVELPGRRACHATQFVTGADVADAIPCGSDVDTITAAAKPFWDAGFHRPDGGTGQRQPPGGFLAAARDRLLPALGEAAGG